MIEDENCYGKNKAGKEKGATVVELADVNWPVLFWMRNSTALFFVCFICTEFYMPFCKHVNISYFIFILIDSTNVGQICARLCDTMGSQSRHGIPVKSSGLFQYYFHIRESQGCQFVYLFHKYFFNFTMYQTL